MLKVYNTLTKAKETFRPLVPGKAQMYVCGMTVYDYCHIGHARVMVVFDVVYRYLKYRGFEVTYVRNITDIDDKIIARALQNQEAIGELTERFIQAMHRDADELLTLRPDFEPRATQNMPEMLSMIEKLIANGNAYAADNGDVYFSVSSFPEYGALSGRQLDELRAGERVEIAQSKRDPLDFVLWKAAKPDEPFWESPWGKGRPGWHIECSAMSNKVLGEHFDIHGGGMDLQFPHHENEIAQSRCATHMPFVNYWMHNGFVRINDEKMSKSLGNFFTIHEVLQNYKGEEIRFFMLSSHYRSPLNYSLQHLDNARAALNRLYTSLRGHDDSRRAALSSWEDKFIEAMDDDFNTPEALAVLFELATRLNRENDVESRQQLAATLKHLGKALGILQADPEFYLKSSATDEGPDDEQINTLIEQRTQARLAKDYAESDRIRDQLAKMGIALEDKDGKTTWRRTD